MFKSGIDYFPLDVDVDTKFQLIEAEFGLKGFAVVVKLFQMIYGTNGYYCEWNDEIALLFGSKTGLGGNAVSDIVSASIRRGIFDKTLFDKYGILTSRGIQKRYWEAARRRSSVQFREEYLLFDDVKNQKNVDILRENVYRNQENVYRNGQSKEEYSKEEYSMYNAREKKPVLKLQDERKEQQDQKYLSFLEMVKSVCPIVWKRHDDQIQMGNLSLAAKVIELLSGLEKTDEELKKFFDHISKTYIVKPSYKRLDVAWALNNWKRVEETEEDQKGAHGSNMGYSQREYSKAELERLFSEDDE